MVLMIALSITSVTPAMATTSTVTLGGHIAPVVWEVADAAHDAWTKGKVVRVSAKRGTVTIDHGPISNLKMMAMTMPFSAADPSLLDGLKKGDEIEFVAEMDGDNLILVKVRRPAS